MKILLTRPGSTGGGVGNYYHIIKDHFNYHVKYIDIDQREKNESQFHMFIRLIKYYTHFIKELFSGNYELIHVNPSLQTNALIRDGLILLIARLFRKKTVIFFRGWDVRIEKVITERYLGLFKFVYFPSNAMIVLASQFRKSLMDMGYHKQIYLETTLVPDEVFELTPSEVNYNGGINILFLSRIEINKGVYEVIDAFNNLKGNHSFLTLTLAGDGSELISARKYIESNKIPDIEITGWIDGEAKKAAFKKADIYLFPTKHGEGMPNSLLEAMAYGLPVITSSVGGVKDFFQDGRMGYFTDGTDHKQIVEVCEFLIKDRKKRLDIGKFNREYAKKHFIASVVCRRLETIYDEVVYQNEAPKNAKSPYH